MTLLSSAYRFAASAVADAIAAGPFERSFTWLGRRVWTWPGAGHAYRSVAGRYAARLRADGDPWRRVSIDGTPLTVDVSEFTTSSLFFGGAAYEPRTTTFLRRVLRPGAVFVDVGANHGYFTLLAAALVGPTGRVHAFEPNPLVAARLAAHVEANAFGDRVVVHGDALADAADPDGVFYVSQDPVNTGLSTLTPWDHALAAGLLSETRTIRVNVETFDRWRASAGVSHVDVLKIDAEQTEDRIVDGMAGSLAAGAIHAIVCETTTGSRAHRTICDAGFTVEILDEADVVSNIAYVRRR